MNDFGLIGLLSMVGLLFTLFGVGFGLYHWIVSATSGVPATTGTVMIAVGAADPRDPDAAPALSLEVQSSAGAQETRDYARMSYGVRKPPSSGSDPALAADHARPVRYRP